MKAETKQPKTKQRKWFFTMYDKLAYATILFIIGQCITWFSSYSQFVWDWAARHPLFIAVSTAVPAALCFIYGMKHAYSFFESGWGPRFYVFSLSFLVFPTLFNYFMNESFFSTKNMICVALAIAIMVVQVKMK